MSMIVTVRRANPEEVVTSGIEVGLWCLQRDELVHAEMGGTRCLATHHCERIGPDYSSSCHMGQKMAVLAMCDNEAVHLRPCI